MNPTRNVKQVGLILLAVLAVVLFGSPASAQEALVATKGEFTLSHEVRWGKALLTPGQYSFSITNSGSTAILTVRGNKQSTFVMTAAISSCQSCGSSALVILNRQGQRSVQKLRLARAGFVLYYGPRREVDESLAKAPEAIERVGVRVAAK